MGCYLGNLEGGLTPLISKPDGVHVCTINILVFPADIVSVGGRTRVYVFRSFIAMIYEPSKSLDGRHKTKVSLLSVHRLDGSELMS